MKTHRILSVALVTLLSWAAPAAQEQLAASIKETREETVRTRNQLQATVNALNALTEQKKGDLRETYKTFTDEVKKTHADATRTAARGQAMQKASAEYFTKWQTDVNGIANESLRKKARKRLDSVQKSYGEVTASLGEAAEKFKPFLSNLDDVQKTLANDITAGGVKAVKGTVSDANFNLKKVRSSIFDALKELESMEKALSPETNR